MCPPNQTTAHRVYSHYRGSYRPCSSWYEAVVTIASHNQMAGALPGQSDREIRPTIPPRHIQSNPYCTFISSRYHMVAWDVRDPTPGVREWLEAIRPGDLIGVCPMVMKRNGCVNIVMKVEVDVYCGS